MNSHPVSSQGLVERLRSLYIMDEVGSDNPLGRDAADALEAQSDRIASLEAALHTARHYVNGVAEGEGTAAQMVIAQADLNVIDAALNPLPSGDRQ